MKKESDLTWGRHVPGGNAVHVRPVGWIEKPRLRPPWEGLATVSGANARRVVLHPGRRSY